MSRRNQPPRGIKPAKPAKPKKPKKPKKISWGRVLNACYRQRLPWCCFMLVRGLQRTGRDRRFPRTYIGNKELADERHGQCSEASVKRAKRILAQRRLVHVLGGLVCPICEEAGRGRIVHTKGGRIKNAKGELVGHATEYEPGPALYELDDQDRQARSPEEERRKPRLVDMWNQVAAERGWTDKSPP